MTGWCDNGPTTDFVDNLGFANTTTLWTRVIACESGAVTHARIITVTAAAGTSLRLAVYSGDETEPDQLLAQTADTAFIDNTTLPIELLTPVDVVNNQILWVAIQASANAGIKGDNTPAADVVGAQDVATGWADGFPQTASTNPSASPMFGGVYIVENPDNDTLPYGTVFVTDGNERIDLNNCGGIYIEDWTPFVPGPKGNGTWRESSLAPGRQLVDWQWENWVDVFTLGMQNTTHNRIIRQEQNLHRLLIKAHQYWTTDWQNEPVWLEMRAPCETHTRYAVIKSWRTPKGSDNPFQQPFSLVGQQRSVIENFQLTIEHGPWLSDEPGVGRCVDISGTQESYPFHLEFDGDDSVVNCGSDAALDNLPAGDFTAEAWIRRDSWGEGNEGRIFQKADSIAVPTTGWYMSVGPAYSGPLVGIFVAAFYAVSDAFSYTLVANFPLDNDWHHIAAVYDSVAQEFTIYIDGIDQTDYVAPGVAGAYTGDAALDLTIGNDNAGNFGFDGDIGWCRITSNQRYAANFTPLSRCVLPTIDAGTVAQWIGPENSGANIDNQQGAAARDGTQTDCEFDVGCEFGRTETCLEEVYIANKHNQAQLTHVFIDDGGAFTTNRMGQPLPYLFLLAVPAVNDAVYFGIETVFDDSGPFCSLVFDILTAIADVTNIAWEYWNGAWVALTVQDNTDVGGAMTGVAFDTTGVNSVHFEQPSDWATTAVNAVTGYWVRARVTAIGAAPTGPIQQNRDIYTILWPYVGIDDAQVLGDITFSLRSIVENQSGGSSLTDLIANRVLFGLRSTDRGLRYTPYINLADEQNDEDITVTAGTNTAFANTTRAPTGRALVYTPLGVEALAQRGRVVIANPLSAEYFGIFHAFVRVTQTNGGAGDFTVQLQITADALPTVESEVRPTQFAGGGAFEFDVLDFGQVRLPGYALPNGYFPDLLTIDIYASAAGAAGRTLTFMDLVLFPVDEWSADIVDPIGGANLPSALTSGAVKEYLDYDDVSYPKSVLSFVRQDTDDEIQTRYNQISAMSPSLQANADQRLWFFIHYYPSTGILWSARPETSHTVQLSGHARYLYARGDR